MPVSPGLVLVGAVVSSDHVVVVRLVCHIRPGLITTNPHMSTVNTYVHFGTCPDGCCHNIGLRNTFAGYVLLVDRLARIR